MLEIFLTFLKIGAFTFGGGYAMIPLIQREAGEKHGWITPAELTEIIAIAESTPGPIAVNAATFVGFRAGGFAGAALATLGVALPSFFVILAVSTVLKRFQEFRLVRLAFMGVRAGVLALILKALFSMRGELKRLVPALIASAAFIAAAFAGVGAVAVLLCCAAAGLIWSAVYAGRREK